MNFDRYANNAPDNTESIIADFGAIIARQSPEREDTIAPLLPAILNPVVYAIKIGTIYVYILEFIKLSVLFGKNPEFENNIDIIPITINSGIFFDITLL